MGKARRWVLQVRLDGEIVEGRTRFGLFSRAGKADLRRLVQAIRRAGEDRKVAGLFLRIAQPQLGWAKAAALVRAVGEFRRSGKPSVSFLEGSDNVDYMVGCACETVVMPPSATLHLHGLQAEVLFVRDLLEWAGIETELESVGEYKSAGEMFVRREMSPPYREEVEALLKDLSGQMVGVIAENRSLEPSDVVDRMERGPYLAEEASEIGLVDRVDHEDACESIFEESLNAEISLLPHGRYRIGERWLKRAVTFRRPRVAVLYVVGAIGTGEDRRTRSPRPVVGARSFCELLKRVREHRRVKAVVVRIESPGGTVLASELIWREIERTQAEKPVVVSMGDVAASGGYYIASAAGTILAEGSTLTGSIGVLGGKMVARRLLDKLGVHRETVSMTSPSSYLSLFQRFSDAERERLQRHLRHFYEKLFVPRVSRGRGLSEKAVDEAGRGRVWTGNQARARGLVDEIGGLEDAIELASRKAGIPPTQRVRPVYYVKRAGLRHLLFELPWSESGATRAWSGFIDMMELASGEEPLFLMPSSVRFR